MRLQRRGMSLVEAVLAVVIFIVVMAGVLVSMLMGDRSYAVNDAVVHVQEEVRRAFDSMVTELRQAGGAVTVTGGTQLDFQLALGYNLPNPCPANAVCWGAHDSAGADQATWRVRYRQNGSQLVRELLDINGFVQAGTRVLANDVSSLAFTFNPNSNIVRIQLQIQDSRPQLPGGAITAGPTPIITQVRLRNAG